MIKELNITLLAIVITVLSLVCPVELSASIDWEAYHNYGYEVSTTGSWIDQARTSDDFSEIIAPSSGISAKVSEMYMSSYPEPLSIWNCAFGPNLYETTEHTFILRAQSGCKMNGEWGPEQVPIMVREETESSLTGLVHITAPGNFILSTSLSGEIDMGRLNYLFYNHNVSRPFEIQVMARVRLMSYESRYGRLLPKNVIFSQSFILDDFDSLNHVQTDIISLTGYDDSDSDLIYGLEMSLNTILEISNEEIPNFYFSGSDFFWLGTFNQPVALETDLTPVTTPIPNTSLLMGCALAAIICLKEYSRRLALDHRPDASI